MRKRTHQNRTAMPRPIQRVEAMWIRSIGTADIGEQSGGDICENGRAGGDRAHYSRSTAARRDLPYMATTRTQCTHRRHRQHGCISHLTDAPNHMKIFKYILYKTTTICAMYATRAKEHCAKAGSPASHD